MEVTDPTAWQPDDWLRLTLVGGVVLAMLVIAGAMAIRGVKKGSDIDSEAMRQIWIAIVGLIGTVVGFLLGSSTSGGPPQP